MLRVLVVVHYYVLNQIEYLGRVSTKRLSLADYHPISPGCRFALSTQFPFRDLPCPVRGPVRGSFQNGGLPGGTIYPPHLVALWLQWWVQREFQWQL